MSAVWIGFTRTKFNEIVEGALGSMDGEMLEQNGDDFAIRVALAPKLADEVAMRLQARAHGVISGGF